MTTPSADDAVNPQLLAALGAVAADIAGILRAAPGPGVPVPGAEWSVGEAAAHLALANELMADLARGTSRPYADGTKAGLAAANAQSLADYPERDPQLLAGEIVRHAQEFVDACGRRPAGEPTRTPLGPMDLGTLASYLLTHMLGHGYDMARALRVPHMIDRERVRLSLPFLLTAMPRVVDERAAAGFSARYRIGVRGGSSFGVHFADGAVTVTPESPERPDCTIVTEPVTFFLMALGRCSPWAAIGRGKIVAWGPKPWLAPRFPACFTAP
jgi:uncharacterized protein (TIGR03083 family)